MSDNPDEKSLIAFYLQQFAERYQLDTLDWRIALILIPAFGSVLTVSVLYTPSHENALNWETACD